MALPERGGHLVQLGVQGDGPDRGDGTGAGEGLEQPTLRVKVGRTTASELREIVTAHAS